MNMSLRSLKMNPILHANFTMLYELDPYSLDMYKMCGNELPTSRLSKVIV